MDGQTLQCPLYSGFHKATCWIIRFFLLVSTMGSDRILDSIIECLKDTKTLSSNERPRLTAAFTVSCDRK